MVVINGDHEEADSSAECAARVQSRNEGVRRRQVAVQLGGLYVARAEGSMWTLEITKTQRGTGWPPEGPLQKLQGKSRAKARLYIKRQRRL